MYRNCLSVLGVVALIGLTSAVAKADSEIRTKEKPAPSYLNPSPNPLYFPSSTEEARIQGTQPITLQQAFELARRNNQSLKVGQLTFERSRAALREQQASVYPSFSIDVESTYLKDR